MKLPEGKLAKINGWWWLYWPHTFFWGKSRPVTSIESGDELILCEGHGSELTESQKIGTAQPIKGHQQCSKILWNCRFQSPSHFLLMGCTKDCSYHCSHWGIRYTKIPLWLSLASWRFWKMTHGNRWVTHWFATETHQNMDVSSPSWLLFFSGVPIYGWFMEKTILSGYKLQYFTSLN